MVLAERRPTGPIQLRRRYRLALAVIAFLSVVGCRTHLDSSGPVVSESCQFLFSELVGSTCRVISIGSSMTGEIRWRDLIFAFDYGEDTFASEIGDSEQSYLASGRWIDRTLFMVDSDSIYYSDDGKPPPQGSPAFEHFARRFGVESADEIDARPFPRPIVETLVRANEQANPGVDYVATLRFESQIRTQMVKVPEAAKRTEIVESMSFDKFRRIAITRGSDGASVSAKITSKERSRYRLLITSVAAMPPAVEPQVVAAIMNGEVSGL